MWRKTKEQTDKHIQKEITVYSGQKQQTLKQQTLDLTYALNYRLRLVWNNTDERNGQNGHIYNNAHSEAC